MKLHLPKLLLSSVLACFALTGLSFAHTATTTRYNDTTYDGRIWTWNNNTTNANLSSSNNTFTDYSDAARTYAGNARTNEVNNFYFYFYGDSSDYTGNTLRFSGTETDRTMISDYNKAYLGGLIVDANEHSYAFGRTNNTRNSTEFHLGGTNSFNATIGADFKLEAGSGSITVEKSGTWSIASGKTLTLNASAVNIDAGTTITIADRGTVALNGALNICVGAKVNIGDHATLDLSSVTAYNFVLDETEPYTSTENGFGTTVINYTDAMPFTGNGTVSSAPDRSSWTINGQSITYDEETQTMTGCGTIYHLVKDTCSSSQISTAKYVRISEGATLNINGATNTVIIGHGTVTTTKANIDNTHINTADWDGLVVVSGTGDGGNDFSGLGANIELKEYEGWDTATWSGDNKHNITLTDVNGAPAWKCGAQYSTTGPVDSGTVGVFSGTWSGSGTFLANVSNNASGSRPYKHVNYKFTGSLKDWTGAFKTADTTGIVTVNLASTEETEIGAAFLKGGENSSFTLTVSQEADFQNSINVTALNLAADKAITFRKDVTAGSLTADNNHIELHSSLVAGGNVTVKDLTLYSGAEVTLNNHSGTLTVNQALSVEGSSTVNANLNIASGATLSFASGAQLTMGCDVTISDGIYYVVVDADVIESFNRGEAVTLITAMDNDIDAVTLGKAVIKVGDTVRNDFFLQTELNETGKGYNLLVAPEPATATLSLLALAALAARRKRH